MNCYKCGKPKKIYARDMCQRCYSRWRYLTPKNERPVLEHKSHWKGGLSCGYLIKHENCKTIMTHRAIMEKALGRSLLPCEVVHHIDGNKSNNEIGNLMVFKHSAMHTRFHRGEKTKKSEKQQKQQKINNDSWIFTQLEALDFLCKNLWAARY